MLEYIPARYVPWWTPGTPIPPATELVGVWVELGPHGRVRCSSRWVKEKPGKYPELRDLLTGKRYRIHRIVASTLMPPSDPARDIVRHLDDNKDNNRPDNLLWGTNRENEDDHFRNARAFPDDKVHGVEVPLQECRIGWAAYRRKKSRRGTSALFGKEGTRWAAVIPGLEEALAVCHARFLAGGDLDPLSPVFAMLPLGPNWELDRVDADGCVLRGRWPGGQGSPSGPGALIRAWPRLPAEAVPYLGSLVSVPLDR